MADNPRNILITGGSGFIGSHAVRHFYHAYPRHRIYNLDLLTYAGNAENLLDLERGEEGLPAGERRYHFIYGDICDNALLDKLFKEHRFELVMNFAAETHVDRSIISMNDFVRTNVSGVLSLIEAVRKWDIPRFVHVSTDEVYGDVPEGRTNEDAALRPSSPYSSSKAAADLIVQSFIRTHRVPAVIVRGSNNFGPHQYPEKLIPLAISNIIAGEKVPVHGTGTHVRSWLHVKDFCAAIELIARHAPDYEVYNVSGEERANLEILQEIARHLNTDFARHAMHVNDRPGADKRYAPDSSKIKATLGWAPSHSIRESMGEVVAWYLTNQNWWKRIKSRKEYRDHYEKQSQGKWF